MGVILRQTAGSYFPKCAGSYFPFTMIRPKGFLFCFFTAAGRVLAVVPLFSKKQERYPVLALFALFMRLVGTRIMALCH